MKIFFFITLISALIVDHSTNANLLVPLLSKINVAVRGGSRCNNEAPTVTRTLILTVTTRLPFTFTTNTLTTAVPPINTRATFTSATNTPSGPPWFFRADTMYPMILEPSFEVKQRPDFHIDNHSLPPLTPSIATVLPNIATRSMDIESSF